MLTGSQSKHDNLVSLCQRQACRNTSRGSEKCISVLGRETVREETRREAEVDGEEEGQREQRGKR